MLLDAVPDQMGAYLPIASERKLQSASFEEIASKPPVGDTRRVAFVVSHYPAGGAQEILANIASGLHAGGSQVRLFALYPLQHASSAPLGIDSWICAAASKPKSPLGLFKLMRSLAAELQNFAPHAIISALPAGNIAAVLAGRMCTPGVKVVMTHHSAIQTHNRVFTYIDGILGRWRNVSAVVCVSDVVSRSLEGKSADYLAKRTTIHNALPPDIERLLANLANERAGRAERDRTVVATGRLATQKNYPALLRAATRMPDVEVIIVGGGDEESTLKQMARELGVDKRVRFIGRRTREETLRELAKGGVFVQPSLFEGHSLALLEAAKLNIPIVVSNIPEQIEGVTAMNGEICGALVDPHDDAALAREILCLLDIPNNYDKGVARSRRLAESCRFDQMVTAYEELVRSDTRG